MLLARQIKIMACSWGGACLPALNNHLELVRMFFSFWSPAFYLMVTFWGSFRRKNSHFKDGDFTVEDLFQLSKSVLPPHAAHDRPMIKLPLLTQITRRLLLLLKQVTYKNVKKQIYIFIAM